MIQLDEIIRRFGLRVLIEDGAESVSYTDFARMVSRSVSGPEEVGSPLDVTPSWSVDALAGLVSGLLSGRNVLLNGCPADAGPSPFRDDFPVLVIPSEICSGRPIHTVYSMNTFLGKFQPGEGRPTRHLVLQGSGELDGLERFLEILHSGGTLVVAAGADAPALGRTIREQRVNVLSVSLQETGKLLDAWESEGTAFPGVGVLSVSGQPLPADQRSRLLAVFPCARIEQRFGLPALGMLPVTEDPVDPGALYLEAPNHTWKVQDGELHVWCPRRMLGTLETGRMDFPSPWYATGIPAERTPRGSIRILPTGGSVIPSD